EDTAPVGGAPPITSDPPFHQHARRLLLPAFSPKRIEPWEPEVRRLCRELLDDALAGDPGVVDAATQYAQHLPPAVIGRMLGLPEGDGDLFRRFVHNILENVNQPPEVRQTYFAELDAYLDAQIAAHEANPDGGLINFLLDAELFGQPLGADHVRG